MPELGSIYQGIILGGLILSLLGVIVNLLSFDGLRRVPTPGASVAKRVSILVPARNEDLNIEACVRSLANQDYPNFELLILDDHSTDGTARILRELCGEGLQLEVLRSADLPEGWTGKSWACDQLAKRADGDFLFFADADTTHELGTVSAAVAYAERYRSDLLSAWPRLLTVTWAEKLIIPMILFLGMLLYPHWLLRWLQSHLQIAKRLPSNWTRHLGAANGQFMFFTRAGYVRIGGHAAVRSHLVEDVALGRAVAAQLGQGMRLANCEALDFSTVRMYRSFSETWAGFTKNVRAAFDDSIGSFLLVGLWQLSGFLLPFVFVMVAPSRWIFGQLMVIYGLRLLIAWRFRTSWLSVIFHPFAQILALGIGLNSWICSARGGVEWKGRKYSVGG